MLTVPNGIIQSTWYNAIKKSNHYDIWVAILANYM